MADPLVRAFVALEVPETVRAVLRGGLDNLRSRLPRARWVRSEGLHLTLKFLGESERDRLERLATGLRVGLAGVGPVRVALGGGGFFPGRARARVVWVGGVAEGAREVAAAVEDAAAGLGWERERRVWTPHLTLARLDRPWPGQAVDEYLAYWQTTPLPAFTCHQAVLMASRLAAGGSVYTPLERVSLE